MQLAQACRASLPAQSCIVRHSNLYGVRGRLQYRRCSRRTSGTVCSSGAGAGDSSDAVTSNDALPAPPKFQTALPWEFMGRKPGVDPWPFKDVTRDKTPHLLMAVKLAHYFTFVAQGGVSWMLYQAAPWLTASFAAGVSGGPQLLHWWGSATATPLTQLGAFLLVLGSVYQAMSGAFFIMAHEYDGWQIATYEWPDSEKVNRRRLDPNEANDERLRLVSYQFLWMFQALGMGISAFAITQAAAVAVWPELLGKVVAAWPVLADAVSNWGPRLAAAASPALAAALLAVWFSCSKWVPSRYFSSPLGPHPVMLTPTYTLSIFITAATAYGISLGCLLGSFWWWGGLAVFFFGGGGLLEAFGAEGSLHQVYHLAAVTIISTGAVLLMFALQKVAKGFDKDGKVIFELQLPWLNSSVQCWLVLLAVVAVTMIWKAKKVSDDAIKVPDSL